MRNKPSCLASAIETDYWVPGDNYLTKITKAIEGRIEDDDIIAVSEKALSVAKGHMVNEDKTAPSLLAKIIARFWMRFVWGYFLGPICHLKKNNISRLRNYPEKEGSAHKQVAFWHSGFFKALLWGSEGGIDASNLPYKYVSLPLKDSERICDEIRKCLESSLGFRIAVMFVDTDKTYSMGGLNFTHRSGSLRGIYDLGVLGYVIGRTFRLKRRSTPLAISGSRIDVSTALDLSEIADKSRGSGAGPTVWDMADGLGVHFTDITWAMLRSLTHRPIVVLRMKGYSHRH